MTAYFYLHGFASSPKSVKAQVLRQHFQQYGLNLISPDLNQADFFNLTLTRQIQQVQAQLPPPPETSVIIGSSFGGLTAAWLGETSLGIERLVLLAPAFGFMEHWLPKLGPVQLQQWQQTGVFQVYHHGEQAMVPLGYQFVTDFTNYSDSVLRRSLPTLIFHGKQDDIIPIEASQRYASDRPWVKLVELDSDHALGNSLEIIWQGIQEFCGLPA
ncbi:MAG: YqiA/YcfP family alpha/beta fold hydrolase [Synechococcales bacterium]|nr:YqiA/YcfP family alpha/beta fold hydrolase [Synechococcales bacterium]